jgi:hypothetical protein
MIAKQIWKTRWKAEIHSYPITTPDYSLTLRTDHPNMVLRCSKNSFTYKSDIAISIGTVKGDSINYKTMWIVGILDVYMKIKIYTVDNVSESV